jgi:hypothetical protein
MTSKFNRQLIFTSIIAFSILLAFTSCERDISDEAVEATYPSTPDIYTDNPVGLTDIFFHSDNPADGANPTAFNVDNNVAYVGRRSIRLDVPEPGNPNGGYVGGVFIDRGNGRNLTKYDALTFYIKASRTVTSGVTFGFGSDYTASNPQDINKYRVTSSNISLSTNWEKVIIPIPDPSVLTQVKGLFALAAGTQATGGEGYIIWIDEIRFEKLGNISLLYPYIFDGQDNVIDGFLGSTQNMTGTGALFNLANGSNIKVDAQHTYFNFTSSNPSVNGPFTLTPQGGLFTTVNGLTGTNVITATLNNNQAQGSLTINAVGNFSFAPTPTLPASNVISIFSNYYPNTPVDFFNGYWAPYQTTQSADFTIAGDDILRYTNFNFVGIQFGNPTLNLTTKPNLHFNMYIPGNVPPNFDFLVTVKNFGPNNVDGGGDDSFVQLFVHNSPSIVANQWMTFNFSLAGLVNKNNVGLIIFENINGSSLSEIYLDNIYFYAN